MKRTLALTTAFVLLVAAVAAAASHFATFSVNPNQAGKATIATLDIKPPVAGKNPHSQIVRVQKGGKFNPKAVAQRCTTAQVNANACPAGSQMGSGFSKATVNGSTHIQPDLKLYLMKPQVSGDIAGVAVVATVQETGQKMHAVGRVLKINTPKYGLETRFANLDSAFKAPNGFTVHVDQLHTVFGHHRTVNGKRVDLLHNPATCNGSWAYQVILGYKNGPTKTDTRTGPCKP